MDVECEKHREDPISSFKDDSKVFGLSCWKDGITIYRNRKDGRRRKFGEDQEFVLEALYLLSIAA